MICWSCEKDAGDGALCPSCGAPQPVASHGARADHFAVLGLERRFEQDTAAMEARFKELSRKLHPDKFAKADPRARKAALQRTVELNEAWRALKEPMRRAEYVLALGGVKIATDDGGARSGGVAAGLAGTPTREALEAAARELVALRYYRRYLDEVAVHEDRAEAPHG
jgi:molecular chaperone HscB